MPPRLPPWAARRGVSGRPAVAGKGRPRAADGDPARGAADPPKVPTRPARSPDTPGQCHTGVVVTEVAAGGGGRSVETPAKHAAGRTGAAATRRIVLTAGEQDLLHLVLSGYLPGGGFGVAAPLGGARAVVPAPLRRPRASIELQRGEEVLLVDEEDAALATCASPRWPRPGSPAGADSARAGLRRGLCGGRNDPGPVPASAAQPRSGGRGAARAAPGRAHRRSAGRGAASGTGERGVGAGHRGGAPRSGPPPAAVTRGTGAGAHRESASAS